ncbi:hypothetical protein [Pectobacterium sp. A5351]|uniref:hypothetical protein n=1 Tax=Pectobacterium sp. A5351 TaxID=2914983 RepID=UPI00232D0698|nr:hypothetical protein [Pectobacterium sp. A5351]WCG84550.1 hypothetical protein O1Q74_08030 [Pectobacterium sp. A5351]
MLTFSTLYFGIMVDAGLFDPLVRFILRLVKYRQSSPTSNSRRREPITEHLDILDCLQPGECETAAERMKNIWKNRATVK